MVLGIICMWNDLHNTASLSDKSATECEYRPKNATINGIFLLKCDDIHKGKRLTYIIREQWMRITYTVN